MRSLALASILSFLVALDAIAAPAALGWLKTWGGSGDDLANNVAVDASGNVYVAGQFTGTVDFDPGAAVDGHTSNGGADAFLAKFAADGTFQWARTWGGIGRDVASGLAVDALGNVLVSGHFQYAVDFDPDPAITRNLASNAGGANNVFVSKFDPAGNLTWVRTFGPSDGGAEGYSVAVDGSGNVFVEGDFSGTTANFNPWDAQHPDWHLNHPPAAGSPQLFDSYLLKLDANGNYLWAKTWGGEGYDDGPGVAVDGQGNAYVAGMYGSQNINFDPAGGAVGAGHPAHDSGIVVDAFVSKFDPSGNLLWVRTWGGQGTDDAAEVAAVDAAGNVYVAGRYASTNCDFDPWGASADPHSSHGSLDAFVVKLDTNGNFQWARTWGGTGWDASGSVAVDAQGTVYVGGIFTGTAVFDTSGTTITSAGGLDAFFVAFDSNGTQKWVETWGGAGDDGAYRVAVDAARGKVYVVGAFEGTADLDPGAPVDSRLSNGGKDVFVSQFGLVGDGAGFYVVTPCRALDTRNAAGPLGGPSLAAGQTRSFALAGTCGVPGTAKAVSANVTVTGGTRNGYVTVFAGDAAAPSTSTINYKPARMRANNAVVRLSSDGTGSLAALNGSAGTAELIVDVNGYFE